MKMSSDIYFNVASWFLGNVRVKPHFNTQCPRIFKPSYGPALLSDNVGLTWKCYCSQFLWKFFIKREVLQTHTEHNWRVKPSAFPIGIPQLNISTISTNSDDILPLDKYQPWLVEQDREFFRILKRILEILCVKNMMNSPELKRDDVQTSIFNGIEL